ncbi:hypothetical protein AUC47_00035 [Microbacterium sp. SZ1]|uniref:hypothetical protein n=1 Tax=Microbacterium sp. SZ1 TaxID=1849736 RepID=UPI000BBC7BAC|nr:hypothetical protein [Microbacterium sp. SZ1]PCE16283.1 hypothetical protein AUC47_00035 [Microbacterium sp. SZ1]
MSDIPRTRRQQNAAPGAERPANAMITEAPVPWTQTRTAAPAALDGQLGWDTPRPSMQMAPGAIRTLETSGDVLPELEEAPERQRPLWRHPAFLISVGTTLLALIAFVVFVILGGLSSGSAATDLKLEVTDNVVRADWSGPDVPYQVIVVDGPSGPTLDVSQLVTGTEAWLPRAAAIVDDGSCIVVRPASGNETAEVKLDRETLDAQGAVSGCVADVPAE